MHVTYELLNILFPQAGIYLALEARRNRHQIQRIAVRWMHTEKLDRCARRSVQWYNLYFTFRRAGGRCIRSCLCLSMSIVLVLGTLILTTRYLSDKFGRDVSPQFQWSSIRLHEVECLKIAKS